jgi:hypothetical protein
VPVQDIRIVDMPRRKSRSTTRTKRNKQTGLIDETTTETVDE